MSSNELILLIVCLLLVATSGLCDERNKSTTVVDDGLRLRSIKEPTEERLFISSLKKWFLGYKATEKPITTTQIQILPVYIPVPVYSDGKIPPSKQYYGAYQKMQGNKKPSVPYGIYPNQVHHSHGQAAPYYIKKKKAEAYYTYAPSYPSVGQANEEHDTVVIDNPDLDIDLANEEESLPDRDLVDHVRRRKKYKKKKLLGQ